jgi:hypothetical protein
MRGALTLTDALVSVPSLVIDPKDLTIGDLEDFEELTGKSFNEAFAAVKKDGSGVNLKDLKAIIFIVRRKTDPAFTIEDARNVKISEFRVGGDEDPTVAANGNST